MECVPAHARMRVYERDHGVCAECGLDTDDLLKWTVKLFERYPRKGWRSNTSNAMLLLSHFGFNERTSLWEADHIIPVIMGGENTLENLRTLCVPCHKKDTAELAASRSKKAQRSEKQIELFSNGNQLELFETNKGR